MAEQTTGNALYRFTADLVLGDEISDRRLEQIASELSDNLNITIVEAEESPNLKVEKFFTAHLHDTTEGRCRKCEVLAYDEKNGDTVVAELEALQA